MRVKQKYYRGNYLIGIYTDDELEQCVAVLDNLHEFAEFIGQTPTIAAITLHRLWNNVCHRINYNGSRYLVYFINNNDF